MESLKFLEGDFPIKNKLSILMLLADGRLTGFRFAYDNDLDVEKIKEEIAISEGYINEPDIFGGAMKLGAGPRTFKDGYLSMLYEVLDLINKTSPKYSIKEEVNPEMILAEKPDEPYGPATG